MRFSLLASSRSSTACLAPNIEIKSPLRERKERLRGLLSDIGPPLQYSDHQIGRGLEFYAQVCEMSLEGIISKRADAPYSPSDRGVWVNVKCENREEFVVVGWTIPRVDVPGSGHCCSRITTRTVGWFMPDASGLGSTMRNSAGSGVACNRSPLRRCRPIGLPLGRTGLVRRGIEPSALGPSRACSRG
jgi:hypothetical protein